jgi:glycosyltransferase involved in cell wall biosynthesis
VRLYGLLRRNNTSEAEKLRALFLNSHFLVVPTDAECFGLVFAEALAHALPAVSRRVDAIPSIIEDDVNGVFEDRHAPAAIYAKRIREIFADRYRYEAMTKAARAKYKSSLTWDACAATIRDRLEAVLPIR